MRMKARFSAQDPDEFDPGTHGATLQLRDGDGMVLCQKIPFTPNPIATRKGVFKFKDKTGQVAAGLRKVKLKLNKKKAGRVSFKARGKKMHFRDPGSAMQVTLRVGTQCTHATATLRTKRAKVGKRLVFP
jgi:hypothetical protein